MKEIIVEKLGVVDYYETSLKQKELRTSLIAGGSEYLILCQHNPVITYGKSKLINNLLVNPEILNKKNIILSPTERGGDITYHEPGQIIIYPIINLNNHKKDVEWYLRNLEEVLILSLKEIGLTGIKINGKTGVWMDSMSKLASIGVSLSKWCSMHGMAININNSMENFKYMHPCGLQDIKMVKLSDYSNISLIEFEDILIKQFKKVFSYF